MNMCLLVFLALKNTPLAFLTAYSYERLNCLHQAAGYTMFVHMVLHAATYTSFFDQQHRLLSKFGERANMLGILAGFSFLTAVFSAIVLRGLRYELFYVVHITFWIVGVIATGFHQPDIGKPVLIMTVLAASMWLTDRILRGARMVYYSMNNTVTLHPLPNGGTKILMKKAPFGAQPGKHCFIWIPAVRKLETHPFTIVSTKPLEFTVRARDGFTLDLHRYATANPGASLRASIDGPYGTFPDPMKFNKIVLIAGGGGATFTFGLAVNILERMNEETENNIIFIWAVRKHGKMTRFLLTLSHLLF
jgi:predicted ferric reductase